MTEEEQKALNLAYKNRIASRRKAWRMITKLEQEEESNNSANLELLRKYRRKIEDEIDQVCSDLIGLLDTYLIPSAPDSETRVFYLKLKADYYRYLAECGTAETNKHAAERCREAYKAADELAGGLSPTNPTKLGVALNYSVFHYDIMNSPETACKLARSGFEAAVHDMPRLEKRKDSAEIVRLIKENLDMWGADEAEEGEETYQRFGSM